MAWSTRRIAIADRGAAGLARRDVSTACGLKAGKDAAGMICKPDVMQGVQAPCQ